MLTDDDLSRQLSGAFRSVSDDLGYAGPVPRARSGPPARWLAVPAVAAVAATVVVAAHQGDRPAGGGGSTPLSASSSPTSPTQHAPRLVTAKIAVAGYTFDYVHPAGQDVPANDLYAVLDVAAVPSDATPTTSDWPGVQAWVGTDASTGYAALYLEGSGADGGRTWALVSPTWTQQQLARLVLQDVAFPVPAVGGN